VIALSCQELLLETINLLIFEKLHFYKTSFRNDFSKCFLLWDVFQFC
jgi:hypothetical protein